MNRMSRIAASAPLAGVILVSQKGVAVFLFLKVLRVPAKSHRNQCQQGCRDLWELQQSTHLAQPFEVPAEEPLQH